MYIYKYIPQSCLLKIDGRHWTRWHGVWNVKREQRRAPRGSLQAFLPEFSQLNMCIFNHFHVFWPDISRAIWYHQSKFIVPWKFINISIYIYPCAFSAAWFPAVSGFPSLGDGHRQEISIATARTHGPSWLVCVWPTSVRMLRGDSSEVVQVNEVVLKQFGIPQNCRFRMF